LKKLFRIRARPHNFGKGSKNVNSNSKVLTSAHLPIGRVTAKADNAGGQRSGFETSIEIPSYPGFVAPAAERIVRKLRKSHCIPGKEDDVRTALIEAMANAVVHGNHRDVKKSVRVRCRFEPQNCVSIIVADEGEGFDPNAVPDPTKPENLQSEHGRGIFLMKAFMDEVHFEKHGTEVHLVKKCEGPVQTLVKNYASRISRYVHTRLPHFKK
jgi:serine/threonine-protein kinase RsbW